MKSSSKSILEQKEELAADALYLANEALRELSNSLEECSTRDLVSIFNSAVKAHRDIVSDIVMLTEKESKAEKDLAPNYKSEVDKLLENICNPNKNNETNY
jgi:hypothetical protein